MTYCLESLQNDSLHHTIESQLMLDHLLALFHLSFDQLYHHVWQQDARPLSNEHPIQSHQHLIEPLDERLPSYSLAPSLRLLDVPLLINDFFATSDVSIFLELE